MIKQDLNETQRAKVEKLKKFVNDPDWSVMEEILIEFIITHSSIETFETKGKNNDEIASDIKGIKIATNALKHFLQEIGALKATDEKEEKKPSFK